MFEVNLVVSFWDVQKSLCAVMIDFVQQMEIFSQHTATEISLLQLANH